MQPVLVGLALALTISIAIVLAVALPHLRQGAQILTPDGKQKAHRARERTVDGARKARERTVFGARRAGERTRVGARRAGERTLVGAHRAGERTLVGARSAGHRLAEAAESARDRFGELATAGAPEEPDPAGDPVVAALALPQPPEAPEPAGDGPSAAEAPSPAQTQPIELPSNGAAWAGVTPHEPGGDPDDPLAGLGGFPMDGTGEDPTDRPRANRREEPTAVIDLRDAGLAPAGLWVIDVRDGEAAAGDARPPRPRHRHLR